jgi:two-component system sensor histidine kinase KdpD
MIKKAKQYLLGISFVVIATIFCYFLSPLVGYRIVSLIFLLTVSIIASFFDVWVVLATACLSALAWNFLFIPPRFTLHISNKEDIWMFFLYVVIAIINGVLTLKLRAIKKIARAKEERSNALKLYSTILNSLSHELRTPIATILVATDNLQAENINLSDQNKKILVSEIAKASLRLNRQVENLLNMSRLESGVIAPKKDWCDIHELIYGVINDIKVQPETRAINIIIAEHTPLCKLDIGLMEEIIQNLVLNAIVYTPDNTPINLRAEVLNNCFILKIEDEGSGFPASELEKVFDKFYRLKAAKTGGIGLGLSIVKGFVEAQNGTINLINKASGGALFTIEIPVETSYINNLKNE